SPVIHQPPQELSIQELEDLKQQYLDELKRLRKLLQLEQWAYLSTHLSKRLHSFCYDDDDDEEDYTIAITPNEPVLSTEELDNSLSMRVEHLDTIPATESDEVIKSCVENLIPIPSESEGIPEHMCDVPSHDNSPPLDVSKDQFDDFSKSNDDFSSIDDDSFSFDKIDYVEASPPNFVLVSSEVMEIVISEVGGIEDNILREKLLNVNHLFAKIEASNNNPIPFYDPIIYGTPSTLTPSGKSAFFLEGDILLLEAFLNDDHSSNFNTKSSSTSLNSLLEETKNFDNSLPGFTTFSNVVFDAEYESDSGDDQSCFDEDVLEKIVSKPLSEEEMIPMKIDQHPDNAESDLMESLRTHDSSLLISSKIDSLLDEFAGELTLLKSIPPYIVEDLISIPSESEGIPDHMCDVPFHDNSPPLNVSKDTIEDLSESNEEFSSTDDDSFSFDKIDYVEASPPDYELVSSKVDAFLAVEDEPTSSQFPKSYLDPEGDMLLFEAFLNDDHSFDFKTKSSSTSLNYLLEETNNFDNSLPEFTTFSNVLCDAEYESDSSDDQSCFDEDVLEKIVLKPLCEEEIILMKSLHTHDSSLPILSKIDSLLEEFAGELTLLKSIPPGIDETDCNFEEDIRLIEKLLYDNSSSRPPEEFVSSNSDAASEFFSPSPILVKDSDSLMEKIDLLCTSDYPMPPGIVDKDYDSERDILIPKDLPSNNSLSFAEKESVHFDIPLFSRPFAKPPVGDTGILNIKMMGDISDQKAFMHKLMITLASHQEKSPDFLSHRYGTIKQINTHRSHLNKCPMLIHGRNNPPLDVLLFHFYPH
nr:hypothetical protein [Tanacetum cinerariifolium]